MQVVRKHMKLSFPNHPSATSISNRQREVALSVDAHSHKKGGPVIQYTSHRKKLNIHADSTKPLLPATRLPLWGLAYLISIPLTAFSRGHIRAYGLSIAT